MSPNDARRPPRLVTWILERLAPASVRDHLLGDLEQEFEVRVRRAGRRGPAARWYVMQALRSLPHLLRERAASRDRVGSAAAADLRWALRSLRRAPAFTLLAVTMLGVGIGANTVVFTFVHGLLMEPLPVAEPDRLYVLYQRHEGNMQSSYLSTPDVRDAREQVGAFRDVAEVTPDAFILQGAGDPQYVGGAEVGTNYFDVLGVAPLAGRTFGPQDVEAARVVIADRLWARAWGRDPGAIGSTVDLDGSPVEIVGVVPDEADVFGATELWRPLLTSIAAWRQSRGTDWVRAVARLDEGVAAEAARVELEQLGRRLASAYPDTNEGQGLSARGLQEQLTGSMRMPLLVLMAAVGLVLLIVCVNLAGLLLARGIARSRELATRIALGVGRSRLWTQLLGESLLIALAGVALGVGLALWGVPVIRGFLPAETPGLDALGVDAPVLLFAAAVGIGATLLFGLAPALGQARGDLGGALAGRSRGAGRGHVRARRALVVGQIALALVLLVGASLFLRSFARLSAVDVGVRVEGVATARLPLVDADFPANADRMRHYEALLRAVAEAPGVEGAGMINALPLRDAGPTFSFETDEPTPAAEGDRLAGFRTVLGDYFGVMGIEVLSGRTFLPEELAGEAPAAVVDVAFERAFFPAGAVGRDIEVAGATRPIVGVVASVPDVTPAPDPRPHMYVPLTSSIRQTMAVVALGRPNADVLTALREAIRSVDPTQTIQSALPMSEHRSRSMRRERTLLGLLGAMGGVALLLAALGTYAILAYVVSQQTREIGVRMALGASRRSVRAMVLASGAKMVLLGLVIGTALAAAATRWVEGLLFRTPALDPGSFVAAALTLVVTALVATYLPASRATRTSPVEALRSE